MPTKRTSAPPSSVGTAVPSFAPDSPRAWVVVFAAFLVSFVTFGVTYSFGVFLKPLEAEFHARHFFITGLFSSLALVSCALAPLMPLLKSKRRFRFACFICKIASWSATVFKNKVEKKLGM